MAPLQETGLVDYDMGCPMNCACTCKLLMLSLREAKPPRLLLRARSPLS